MYYLQGRPLIQSLASMGNILNRRLFSLRLSVAQIISIFFLSFCVFILSDSAYPALPDKNKILIVHQGTNSINQKIIHQLEQNSSLSGYQIQQLTLNLNTINLDTINSNTIDISTLNSPQLIIAIGNKTTKHLLDSNVSAPMLSVLIPKRLTKSFQTDYPDKKNWSSLVIDQPIERQFHLITAILGKHKKIGVLLGPYTSDMDKPLKKSARKTKHRIVTEHIKDPALISASIKSLNTAVDVLLTLPDPVIYNKSTIRGILLSSYRKKLPIIGFSKAYVKAGAIAAVYSKPEQISQQLADISHHFLKTGSFQKPLHYPKDFSVALNKKLAKSIGINMKNETVIIKRIKKAERPR